MSKTKLQNILNATFELEGLVTLALNGKQDMMRLRQLMIDKAETISTLCESLGEPEISEPIEINTEVVVEKPVAPVKVTEEKIPEIVKPKPAPVVPPTAAPKPPVITINNSPERPLYSPAATPKETPAPSHPVYSSPASSQGVASPSLRKPLRKMFPINEWFLFRRELFAGSDEDFNASLSVVEELGSIGAAEAYFYNDLQWNPDAPNVADFMRIVTKYFNQ